MRTAGRAARSGAGWGVVFGLYVASSALGYASSYKTAAQRDHLAATFGSDPGIAALVGPARQIQTVAGYTVWKCLGVLSIVGAAWALLAATRLLRGEEDAGRWELLLAGQTTRRGAAAQGVAGLAAGLGALWVVTASITVAVGRSTAVAVAFRPAVYLSVALVAPAGVFLAVGALTSQLAASRRQAATYAGAALGVSYALRMIADSGTGLGWLRWATPLGWVEELQPLTGSRPGALAPLAALAVTVAVAAVLLAGRRDLGASTVPDRDRRRPRTGSLNGALGLAARLAGGTVAAWTLAVVLMALVVGAVAKQAGSALTGSADIQRVLSRLGARGSGAGEYLGVAFLVLAVLLALLAAGQVSAARAEEAEGRAEHLLVRAVPRSWWLGGRAAVAGAAVVTAALLGGLFAWFGAASQGSGVGLGRLLAAGANLAPPALFVLGAGLGAMGFWPGAAYGVLAWSFLVQLVGGFVASNRWLLDTSVFHHMAAAPAVTPNWASAAVLTALGAAGAVAGLVGFSRRDLVGE